MANFGKYAVLQAVTHPFAQLENCWWKIRPPTAGDDLEMSRFLWQGRRKTLPDGSTIEIPPTNAEIMFREVALLFGGTNLPKEDNQPVEEGGEPYIKTGAPVHQVEAALMKMPFEMVDELWAAIGEATAYKWGRSNPNARSAGDAQTSPS